MFFETHPKIFLKKPNTGDKIFFFKIVLSKVCKFHSIRTNSFFRVRDWRDVILNVESNYSKKVLILIVILAKQMELWKFKSTAACIYSKDDKKVTVLTDLLAFFYPIVLEQMQQLLKNSLMRRDMQYHVYMLRQGLIGWAPISFNPCILYIILLQTTYLGHNKQPQVNETTRQLIVMGGAFILRLSPKMLLGIWVGV